MKTQMLSAATPTGSRPSFCIRSPCSPQIYAERSESAAQLSSLKTLLKIGRPDLISECPPGLPGGRIPGDLRAAAGEHKKVVAGDQVNYQLQEGCKQSCDPRRLSARQPRQHSTDRDGALKAPCVPPGTRAGSQGSEARDLKAITTHHQPFFSIVDPF